LKSMLTYLRILLLRVRICGRKLSSTNAYSYIFITFWAFRVYGKMERVDGRVKANEY
jgi:hypothetical protein